MEVDEKEDHRRIAEGARRRLAEGTWPQVVAVFGYANPNAPRTPEEEFIRLGAVYAQVACPNLVRFIELLRFTEQEHGVTMSFNLSLRRRLVPGDAPEPTAETVMFLFSCPDILVGTRGGVEGAAVWLKNFSEAIPSLPPESVQMMDKIFGEAVEVLTGPSRATTVQEMFESVVLGEGETLAPPTRTEH